MPLEESLSLLWDVHPREVMQDHQVVPPWQPHRSTLQHHDVLHRVHVDTRWEEAQEPWSRGSSSSQGHDLSGLLKLASAVLWVMSWSSPRSSHQPPWPSSGCFKHHLINEQHTLTGALLSSQIGSCPLHPSDFHIFCEVRLLGCHPCRAVKIHVQDSSHCPCRNILQQLIHSWLQVAAGEVRILINHPVNCIDLPLSIKKIIYNCILKIVENVTGLISSS